LTGLQVWNAISISAVVKSAENAAGKPVAEDELKREKLRQELIGKRIENDSKGELPIGLTSGLSAAIAALVTVLGAILALRGYLDAREKERLDRLESGQKELAARERERQDRLSGALDDTLGRLVSAEWRERVVGAAGLLPFFTLERADFHRQALTALVAAARLNEEDPAVRQCIRLAVEQAVRVVEPDVLTDVSWQGVRLPDVNLSGAVLKRIDLRDAVLENAQLSAANLEGANLTAAQLQGAQLNANAVLTNATLSYADLAGASLSSADLTGSDFSNAKVLDLDLEEAKLFSLQPGWADVPWDATRNWRKARFDGPVRAVLEQRYGSATPSPRVLMLMWEIPPMVAGGTWTACYHLVRSLHRRGVQVTVVVPWASRAVILDPPPFGVPVPIVTLNIEVPGDPAADLSWSPYGSAAPMAASIYRSAWSPYGSAAFMAPSIYRAPWSPYGAAPWGYGTPGGPYGSPYGAYNVYAANGSGTLLGSSLYRLIGAFRNRLRDYIADHPCDVIHAHDWVTFDAARAAAERIGVPWVAHFHSTEAERQPGSSDPLTERIEQSAVDSAARLVTVSAATHRSLIAAYDAAKRRPVDIVPNCFSEGIPSAADMGRFETKRVIFLGRLSRQKGVDRFCEVVRQLRQNGVGAEFLAYGDGPERTLLWQSGVRAMGSLPWDQRGVAFRGASVLLVPSRFEPFGMVVLEAMQHRVPVIYPATSGAAEVLEGGVKIVADDIPAIASAVGRLLGDLRVWEESVLVAARDIERYSRKRVEDRLVSVWTEATAAARK
jgi:glycosyltransferase involved in cell wall biosynthesis/uncharacterized protein YjbI with pentapeptide repeats